MDIYELIGFIIGDGNIYYNKNSGVYRLELCGNVEEDYDYFKQIQDFLIENTNKKPAIFVRNEKKGKSLRIQFNNKEFVERLIDLGLVYGKKTFSASLPQEFINNDKIMFAILRGLFESDGCLYFSKSKIGLYPTYPRLEIKSSSPRLVNQIKLFLESSGFNFYVKKSQSDSTYSIVLSGNLMLKKWSEKVGFVSLKNISKYNIWKSKGFYTPNTPLNERLKICGDGTAATAVDIFKINSL